MPQIDHIIVLMLENRSFDFMFGFLKDSKLDPIDGEFNQLGPMGSGSEKIFANDKATPGLPLGPDHSHAGVMHQLFNVHTEVDPGGTPNCKGFLNDYEEFFLKEKGEDKKDRGKLIMECLPTKFTPVLSGLAREFGVFAKWFSSVPGETWPNRNFAHAATSSGEVNIAKRTYADRTIFEVLEDNERTWGIFHDAIPQVFVFRKLWTKGKFGRSDDIDTLRKLIASDSLPSYSWVEPVHFGKKSSSQHPGNNEKDDRDFRAGEQLILDIYTSLYNAPQVFEKTLFLVTYDEHGGHFDHVAPPRSDGFRDGRTNKKSGFQFDLLGVRVPCVGISPFVEKGAVDKDTVFDHSSIVRTVRETFVPQAAAIEKSRDGATANAMKLLTRATARAKDDMPTPESLRPQAVAPVAMKAMRDNATAVAAQPAVVLDDFQRSLYWLAKKIEKELAEPVPVGKGKRVGVASAKVATPPAMSDVSLKTKTVGEVEDETNRAMKLVRERINAQQPSVSKAAPRQKLTTKLSTKGSAKSANKTSAKSTKKASTTSVKKSRAKSLKKAAKKSAKKSASKTAKKATKKSGRSSRR